MNEFQWFDGVRAFNAVLAVFVMYLVGLRFSRERRRLNPMVTDFFWAISAVMLLLAIGSIEQILQDVPFGNRLLLTTLVLAVFVSGSVRMHRNPGPPSRKRAPR